MSSEVLQFKSCFDKFKVAFIPSKEFSGHLGWINATCCWCSAKTRLCHHFSVNFYSLNRTLVILFPLWSHELNHNDAFQSCSHRRRWTGHSPGGTGRHLEYDRMMLKGLINNSWDPVTWLMGACESHLQKNDVALLANFTCMKSPFPSTFRRMDVVIIPLRKNWGPGGES